MKHATISRRLDAAEGSLAAGGGPRCPDCDGPGDAEPDPSDTYELVFTTPEEAGENEWCPRCGRQTRIIIGWGNDQTS
jgi:hypothetical protein